MQLRSVVLALLTLAALSGCGGHLQDVVTTRREGGGTAATYAAPRAKAWAAVHDVLRLDEHVDMVEDHEAEGYVLAKIDASTIPIKYGAFIGAWLEPVGADQTRVVVVTRRTEATWGTGLTEATFQKEIATRLATP